MFSRRLLPLLAILLALPAHALAGDRYVATNGNQLNGNTCSDAQHPCSIIEWAVGQSASGDTIHIGPGTYHETVTAPSKVLTFVGAGNGTNPATSTIVDGTGQDLNAFRLPRGGFLQDLRAISEAGAAITATPTVSSDLTTQRVVAVGTAGQPALEVDGSSAALGLSLNNSSFLQTGTYGTYAVNLNGNVIANANGSTFSSTAAPALRAGSGFQNLTDSTLTGTTGVLTYGSGGLTLRRTRATGTAGEGVRVYVSSTGPSTTTLVEDSVARGTTFGAELDNGSTHAPELTLRNSTAVASGSAAQAAVYAKGGTAGHVTLDGSVAAVLGGPATAHDLHTYGPSTMTAAYSAFRTAIGHTPAVGSATNVAADPQLGADLSPNQGSPLIDHGDQAKVLGNEKDVTGGARVLDGDHDGTATVDIGAFEHAYVAPPTPKPPVTDTTKPKLGKVSLRGRTLRFTVSEKATVSIKILRGKKTVRKLKVLSKGGRTTVHLKNRLKPGRYRIVLNATDVAGNRSKPLTKKVRVRRKVRG